MLLFLQIFYSLVHKIEICLKYVSVKNSQKQPSWNDKKHSWMDPKLENKLIPNYFFLQSWHEMAEKFAKVFNMKIAPMLLLMTQKHQTSQARYLQFLRLLWFWRNPHKTKFLLKSRFLKDRELYWSNLPQNSNLGQESFV